MATIIFNEETREFSVEGVIARNRRKSEVAGHKANVAINKVTSIEDRRKTKYGERTKRVAVRQSNRTERHKASTVLDEVGLRERTKRKDIFQTGRTNRAGIRKGAHVDVVKARLSAKTQQNRDRMDMIRSIYGK